ncbi:cell division protein FtsB [Candidatus Rickettsiella isopodorum]|jgi:cell division protein FtsB|uniref:Cell division protein FtsB n=1 Tax=Candidatus Rickettsiella isopodorum TaxID=1225476 RepID=A0A1J8P780_9COXI|nr:cell division protein FtsB [Candidatus Rickettsiella isopodorum]MCH9636924.1 cell division protein FtsB [Gammaproteobacteria bacterium]MDQ5899500.1 cell division protein FtsB [Pseudomonadota bacterium]MCH9754253.1 cell division protein FtsB [Gammaproteobacteria bacterium]MDD4892885.1 cell division protein FtsB [Candidatus Rickettsiella isopodorum]MDD5162403.1 cell division protein FtsB [Candidatus Rickettsiella isopodorum]
MKPLIVILTLLFLSLQYKLWFVQEGVWRVHQLKKQITMQMKENTQLSQRNTAMVAEIKDLKSGKVALEEHARHDLNMVKSNELFYMLVDKPEKKKKANLH